MTLESQIVDRGQSDHLILSTTNRIFFISYFSSTFSSESINLYLFFLLIISSV